MKAYKLYPIKNGWILETKTNTNHRIEFFRTRQDALFSIDKTHTTKEIRKNEDKDMEPNDKPIRRSKRQLFRI